MISRKDLQPIADSGTVGGLVDAYKDRYIMLLPSDRMGPLKDERWAFWDGMSDCLNSIELQSALIHKFQPLLEERLGPNMADMSFSPEVLFMQDQGK